MTRKANGNERSVPLSTIKNVTGKLFMLPHEKHIQLYKIIIFYNSGNRKIKKHDKNRAFYFKYHLISFSLHNAP